MVEHDVAAVRFDIVAFAPKKISISIKSNRFYSNSLTHVHTHIYRHQKQSGKSILTFEKKEQDWVKFGTLSRMYIMFFYLCGILYVYTKQE